MAHFFNWTHVTEPDSGHSPDTKQSQSSGTRLLWEKEKKQKYNVKQGNERQTS